MPASLEWLGMLLTLGCVVIALLLGLRLARRGTPVAFRQALYAHRQGDDSRALELLSSLIAERPDDYAAHHLRAMVNRRRGALGEARADSERLIALRPDLYYGHSELGLTLLAQGSTTEAARALRKAVAAASHLAEARFNLGLVQVQAGDHEGAAETLARALRLGLRDQVTALIARYHLMRACVALGYDEQADLEWRRLRRSKAVLRRWRRESGSSGTPVLDEQHTAGLMADIETTLERGSPPTIRDVQAMG
jgi:predicted Zn-dependent protease